MPRFHCKHCGIVSDDAEIIPLPEEDEHYRGLIALYPPFGGSRMHYLDHPQPFNHKIVCPVCLGETTFWRKSPFPLAPLPTDGRINLDGSPFSLSIKAMLSDMNL